MEDEFVRAIELALEKYEEKHGEKFAENGANFLTLFDNFSLLISYNDGDLKMEIIEGKPFIVDGFSLSIFGKEEC